MNDNFSAQERAETPEDEKPLIQTLKLRPARRRPRKIRENEKASDEDVPLSITHDSNILDDFEDTFNDYDNGFATIKDLAERGITKMEPLDYDDFYLGAYDDEPLSNELKNEASDTGENEANKKDDKEIKDEPPDEDLVSKVTKSEDGVTTNDADINER